MFNKILIANRGEIACRIMRTAHQLGIATVAVYSEADAHALHTQTANEAYAIGPAPPRQSYLSTENILTAARKSGAQAIHPGYGFLSENADFAQACADANLTFIGPPPSAIRAMGSKAAAKSLMAKAGVPLVPGYHDAAQDLATLTSAAQEIGYPILIKASAGGGGKGMRIVTAAAELEPAIESAKREAASAFGDDRLLIEKYLTTPRHIEIQVFADTHGNCVSLFERDCSIQRRHQKVLEEAPAPGMDPARREVMGQAAVNAAKAVDYVGAGTVEFIAENNAFFFMEMNTRLQVEHPVTEMITNTDLVEWQLRIARGEPLPLSQSQLRLTGHAIEARIYAEDPARDFLPSIGSLVHLRQPTPTAEIRVDTGVRQGDAITPYYDPMIAKLIAHGADRPAALRHLRVALNTYEVVGVQTNLALLRAIASHDEFETGGVDTGFIARHPDLLAPRPIPFHETQTLAAACLAIIDERQTQARLPTVQSQDPWSPWNDQDNWRMNGDPYQDIHLAHANTPLIIRAHGPNNETYRLDLPTGTATAKLEGTRLTLDGVTQEIHIIRRGNTLTIVVRGQNTDLQTVDPLAPPPTQAAGEGRLTAPIPARITRIAVAAGDHVDRGTSLLVIEAMKMELSITAPFNGTVERVFHAVGDMVEEGATLIALTPAAL